ncbi:hypothetical protein KCP73_21925 [Salmonella enterica subsp. enterica]|nr:hypothetical protein KCP73_21925 [Salmonella enterica subsp. enterica]
MLAGYLSDLCSRNRWMTGLIFALALCICTLVPLVQILLHPHRDSVHSSCSPYTDRICSFCRRPSGCRDP